MNRIAFCIFAALTISACRAANYGEALDACVANAKTRAESEQCRCETAKKYDRPCDAQTNEMASDGGTEE